MKGGSDAGEGSDAGFSGFIYHRRRTDGVSAVFKESM